MIQKIITEVDVKVVGFCELLALSVGGLREVLQMYPEWALVFTQNLPNSLHYNLREVLHTQLPRPSEPQPPSDQESTDSAERPVAITVTFGHRWSLWRKSDEPGSCDPA